MKYVKSNKLFLKRFFVIDDSETFDNLIGNKQNGVFYFDSFKKQNYDLATESLAYTYVHELGLFKEDSFYSLFNKTIRNSINWCEKTTFRSTYIQMD